ncbi:KH domain-containing protein [Patescibacteria group bacterium]|nr:KH domain-containing protein [Patescibacteria group bacterium]
MNTREFVETAVKALAPKSPDSIKVTEHIGESVRMLSVEGVDQEDMGPILGKKFANINNVAGLAHVLSYREDKKRLVEFIVGDRTIGFGPSKFKKTDEKDTTDKSST